MSEQSFQLHYKTITIYGDWEKPVPVVYFHSFQKEGQQVKGGTVTFLPGLLRLFFQVRKRWKVGLRPGCLS